VSLKVVSYPQLYNIYSADQSFNTTLATFAYDTAIISTRSKIATATNNLKDHLTRRRVQGVS
jgi:hypothetical protein